MATVTALHIEPCPFCGAKDDQRFVVGPDVVMEGCVLCLECNARGPLIVYLEPNPDPEAVAIDAWNERVK